MSSRLPQPDVNSSERSKAPSCGLVIAWRTNCAVAQLAMNPLQEGAPFLLRKVRKSNRSGDYSSHQSIAIFPPEKFDGLRPDANNLSSARTERHHPFGAVSRKTGWSKAPLQPTGSSGGVDFRQLGAATAKDPSLVASLVCRLFWVRQFPSRHCRTYRTLLALRSRTLRHQSGGALRALAMYRKSTGRRDRLSIDLGTGFDAGIGTGHKTPCFGYACAAMVG